MIVKPTEELDAARTWNSIRRRNLHNKLRLIAQRHLACGFVYKSAKKKEDRMKLQTIMQTHLVIAGLATVLLFPGVTKAQEISNTAFDDGPNTAPFAQPVPAQGAVSSSSTLPSGRATPAMVPIDSPITGRTADEQDPSAALIWIGAVLVWIGAIGLYARGPAKHLTRELGFPRDSHTSSSGD